MASKLGRYELKSELGRGGMAIVYLAHDPHFERDVAIKVLPSEFLHDRTFYSRFEREAKAIAKLEHPAIVPVYDYGEDRHRPYLVMRHMPGGSLKQRMARGRVPLAEFNQIIQRIGLALDEAHLHNMVHRDVKPGNIMFDRQGHAYLSDFGIVMLAESTTALTGGAVIGTPDYMSPEQILGEKLDGRSDVYALGVVLFLLLTGRPPFEADTPMGLAYKHVHAPVPSLIDFRADLPPVVQAVVDKALAKDRNQRFTTAGELSAALNSALLPKSTAVPVAVETESTEPQPPVIPVAATSVAPPSFVHGKATELMETVPAGGADPAPPDEVAPSPTDQGFPPGRSSRWVWMAGGLAAFLLIVLCGLLAYVISRQLDDQEQTTTALAERQEASPYPSTSIVESPTIVNSPTVGARQDEPSLVVDTPVAAESPTAASMPAETATAGGNRTSILTEQWAASAHADAESPAFTRWNEADPAEVPVTCAKCHTGPGFLDFIGADGGEPGEVEQPVPVGTVIDCETCHNEAAEDLTTVLFPSGVEVTDLGPEASCMTCHQGRNSSANLKQALLDAGLSEGDEDAVLDDLGFFNIHYYAAAATQYGTVAMGGYEYDGQTYDARYQHVTSFDTCIDCHDPHTLEIQFEDCLECHGDLESVEDLATIRMAGSSVDYDGDGDLEEGILGEIQGFQEMLYRALQSYAGEVIGDSLVYDVITYPYYFYDTNDDGQVDDAEVVSDNRFASWTPRLSKAAYNYQVSQKDPGQFAHGGKYIIQLLYDSIESLNEALSRPIDLSAANRIDPGHFAGSTERFRHWDEEGVVPASCSRCHSAEGLPLYVEQGVSTDQPVANGLRCDTCHNDLNTYSRYESQSVEFPSGAQLSLAEVDADEGQDSNLCLNCHQGRLSSFDVDQRIQDLRDDELSDSLSFVNIHYFAAGATLFGTEAKGAYEYAGQEYFGRNQHVPGFDVCTECHDTHALEVDYENCANCHDGIDSAQGLQSIRETEVDFDGDGDTSEGLAGELETMRGALLLAMQAYAERTEGVEGITYDPDTYPYFYNNAGERYLTWTPALLRASYNYQYATRDPGAYSHNGLYIIQILYDSLRDIDGDVSGMSRPS